MRLRDMATARSRLAGLIESKDLYPELTQGGRMAEAIEEMRAAINFRFGEGDIFVLSYMGATPEQAQAVVTELTNFLIDQNTRLRSEQAELAREFLDAEKKRNEADLMTKETALYAFLAEHPEFAQEQGGGGAMVRKGRTGEPTGPRGDNALSALRREEERLKLQIASPASVGPAPVDPQLATARSAAQSKLDSAQRELADRRSRFTEQHPDVRSALAMVKDAQSQLDRAAAAIEAAQRDAPRVDEATRKAQLQARLQQVQQEIAAQTRRRDDQARAPEITPIESSDAARRIVAVETEWARLNREVEEARDRIAALDSRQFVATMAASSLVSGKAAQIIIVDPAYLPTKPLGTSDKRFVLFGVALGLMVGAGLALLLALIDDRIYDRVDLERLRLAPVLAEVPRASIDKEGLAWLTKERI